MSRPAPDAYTILVQAERKRRRSGGRPLTYGDLPPEVKEAIKDYLRFTNASLRAAVDEYFRSPRGKAATERRYGKIGTWDVGRVTDMSKLFRERKSFNEARAGVRRRRSIVSTRVEECRFH